MGSELASTGLTNEQMSFHGRIHAAIGACSDKEKELAYLVYSGVERKHAIAQIYGEQWLNKPKYKVDQKYMQLMNGPAGVLFGLLSHPMNEAKLAPYTLSRIEKLSFLSNIAALAYKHAEFKTDDGTEIINSQAVNQAIRAISELNKMQGDHSAQQIEVQKTILSASLTAELSTEQATDLYRQVMQGGRIDDITTIEQAIEAEYEPIDYYNSKNIAAVKHENPSELTQVERSDTSEPIGISETENVEPELTQKELASIKAKVMEELDKPAPKIRVIDGVKKAIRPTKTKT